jgi:hypothetical protein
MRNNIGQREIDVPNSECPCWFILPRGHCCEAKISALPSINRDINSEIFDAPNL